MPKIYSLKKLNKREIVKEIKAGKIFIYPTDTIYGLGCNALDVDAVKRLRKIKKRQSKPLSVIAPSRDWIMRNFDVKRKEHIKKLPGPFTFILEKKKNNVVPKEVSNKNSVGIRIPDCEFTKLVEKSKVPFITTSVNISGKKYALSIKDISREIFDKVDIVIEDGVLENKPSTLLDYRSEIPKVIKRN